MIPAQGPVDTSEVLMLHLFLRWGPSAVQLVEYTNREEINDPIYQAYCTSSQRKAPHHSKSYLNSVLFIIISLSIAPNPEKEWFQAGYIIK